MGLIVAATRLKALLPVTIMTILSLLLYGNWPRVVWYALQDNPPDALASITLWNVFGIASWLLWLIPLALWKHLSYSRRFLLLFVLVALTLPYFQYSGYLALLVMPIGPIGLLANLMVLSAYDGRLLWLGLVLPLAVGIRSFRHG